MTKISLEYRNHIVAFLDVLGFRQMILGKDLERIDAYLKASRFSAATFPNLPVMQTKMITFSDSIVVFMDIGDLRETEQVSIATASFLMTLSNMQLHLARHGVWSRGGISVGDLFFDDKNRLVVGPAFIEAYDLESKLATFPRVLVSQKIMSNLGYDSAGKLIDKINSMSSWPVLFPWREGLSSHGTFQKDYPLFVNYLSLLTKPENNKLLDTVVRSLECSSKTAGVAYGKYRWVADYISVLRKMQSQIGPTGAEIAGDSIDQVLRSI